VRRVGYGTQPGGARKTRIISHMTQFGCCPGEAAHAPLAYAVARECRRFLRRLRRRLGPCRPAATPPIHHAAVPRTLNPALPEHTHEDRHVELQCRRVPMGGATRRALRPDVLAVQEVEPIDSVLLFAGDCQPTCRDRVAATLRRINSANRTSATSGLSSGGRLKSGSAQLSYYSLA
jgi:hypothetical protein